MFNHIEIKREFFCAICESHVPDGRNCHGEDNIRYFVMANLEKQLTLALLHAYKLSQTVYPM